MMPQEPIRDAPGSWSSPAGGFLVTFYGIEFSPRDLRLALVEAAANTIASPGRPVAAVLLPDDPATGRYSLVVRRALQLAGLATVFSLAGFMVVCFAENRSFESRGSTITEPNPSPLRLKALSPSLRGRISVELTSVSRAGLHLR